MPQLFKTQQESFVHYLLEGLSATRAYQKAYPEASYAAASNGACLLLKKNAVRIRLAELRAEVNKKVVEEVAAKVVNDLRNKETRIAELSELFYKMKRVMKKRSDLYKQFPGADIKLPGHEEGIVIPQLSSSGKLSAVVDTGLIRELRAVLEQISVEVGPSGVDWETDDGLKQLAEALSNSPTSPPQEFSNVPTEGTPGTGLVQ